MGLYEEIYEELHYTIHDLSIIKLGADRNTKSLHYILENCNLESVSNNILALSDVINKIDAGETVDTRFNLVDTRDNAVLLKEAEKQKALKYFQQLIEDIKNL